MLKLIISKKENFNKLLLVTLFLIIIKQTNFFRNAYFVIREPYNERLLKQYEFCGYESIGFLNYIKNKYKIDYKIPIINFGNSPNPNWFFSDLKNINNEKKIILLNYGKNQKKLFTQYQHYNLSKYKIIEKLENCYFVELR